MSAQVRTLTDGREVIDQETGCYYARYRDADGIVRTVSTGCRDRTAAEQALANLERQAERVKSGIMSRAELSVVDRLQAPIARHIRDYVSTLGNGRHATLTRRYLERLSESLGWRVLSDLRRDDLELWLADQARPGPDGKPIRSARSRVGFQTAAVAFCNWLVVVKRLTLNPFCRMPKANIEADRRRVRRALSPSELGRLILAAQHAPERASAEGKAHLAPVRLSGRSRGILYAFLAQTGIRVGEARKICVGDLDLDGARPGVYLLAPNTKNREPAFLPLRSDLVDHRGGSCG
jgi:integrase